MAQTYAIIFAAPLLITVLAIPILGETVGWRRSVAVGVGLVGVIVVLRPGVAALTAGHLAALGAAVCSAVAAVVVRKIGNDERSAVLLLYPMMANFILMGFAMPFVYRAMPAMHLGGSVMMGDPRVRRRALRDRRLSRRQRRGGGADAVFADPLGGRSTATSSSARRRTAATAIGAAIIILSGIYVVFREDRRTSPPPARAPQPEPLREPAPIRASAASGSCSAGPRKGPGARGRPRPSRPREVGDSVCEVGRRRPPRRPEKRRCAGRPTALNSGRCRSVAQPGSAPASGAGGRRFESSHSDQPRRGQARRPAAE